MFSNSVTVLEIPKVFFQIHISNSLSTNTKHIGILAIQESFLLPQIYKKKRQEEGQRKLRPFWANIVVDIDNVSNDKSPFSNGERGFRGMGLVFKTHGQSNNKTHKYIKKAPSESKGALKTIYLKYISWHCCHKRQESGNTPHRCSVQIHRRERGRGRV